MRGKLRCERPRTTACSRVAAFNGVGLGLLPEMEACGSRETLQPALFDFWDDNEAGGCAIACAGALGVPRCGEALRASVGGSARFALALRAAGAGGPDGLPPLLLSPAVAPTPLKPSSNFAGGGMRNGCERPEPPLLPLPAAVLAAVVMATPLLCRLLLQLGSSPPPLLFPWRGFMLRRSLR